MMTQTVAMLVDAYRELNHRKLFWITLSLSGLVVAVFACFGVTDTGVTFLRWEFEVPGMQPGMLKKDVFYKTLFLQFGVEVWLSWIAAIMALVSTASIFPDFLTSGAIDLWLSKPISRLRLFLTKYVFGLLFVALQVAVFSAACFLVLGLRGGVWAPSIFLAVPLVVCFFSYLWAFCVLFGVFTRSTIAALLLTLLVWFGLFLVNTVESVVHVASLVPREQARQIERRIDIQEKRAQPNEDRLAQLRAELIQANRSAETWAGWHRWALRVKSVLPKTDETIELLERRLVALADLPKAPDDVQMENLPVGTGEAVSQRAVTERVMESRRSRSAWWILGTSFAFEAVVVAIAAWLFCRRDY